MAAPPSSGRWTFNDQTLSLDFIRSETAAVALNRSLLAFTSLRFLFYFMGGGESHKQNQYLRFHLSAVSKPKKRRKSWKIQNHLHTKNKSENIWRSGKSTVFWHQLVWMACLRTSFSRSDAGHWCFWHFHRNTATPAQLDAFKTSIKRPQKAHVTIQDVKCRSTMKIHAIWAMKNAFDLM